LYIQFQNGRLRLTYDKPNYPSLLSLQYQDGDLKVELSMSPGGFSWEAEGVEGYWLNPRDPVEPYWNDEKLWFGTRMVTFSAAVADTGRYGVSETYLVNGYPLRAIEKIYKDENRDELIHTREIIFDDGVPVAGRRSYRMDPDNPVHRLWELYERYEDGELSGLAWDPGMTGSPAYLRDWALTGYLETQIWDLNSDGWIDVRRFLLPDDEVMVKDLLITEARREDLIPWQASDWSPWEQ
ncbi:MAG: hypothetical protein KAH21_06835, partial [Spirochaetaceae bacterium]|nr:hypothetical protein [Spirochaetaceae bacterium]